MPIKPKRPCTYPGCGILTNGSRCEVHQAAQRDQVKAYDKSRGSAHSRGYSWKWTQYSKKYRRDNPLCVDCLADGILTSVEHGGHVDHVIAVAGPDDPNFWNPMNHASRCAPCHAKKTIREDGGFTGKAKNING